MEPQEKQMSNHIVETGLSEKQERLLLRYLDGECGLVGRMRAERLLSSSAVASSYAAAMRQASRGVREALAEQCGAGRSADGGQCVDLWQRIAARIDQEEKAEFFLGKRKLASAGESAWDLGGLWEPVKWGFSGALVTAAAVVIVFRVSSVSPGGETALAGRSEVNVQRVAGLSGGDFSPVGLMEGQSGRESALQTLNVGKDAPESPVVRRVPRVFEVGWMKSPGRVKVIQDSNQRSAILWVDRKDGSDLLRRQANSRGNGYEAVVDVTPQIRGREPIRILDDDLPTARSAYDGE